MLGQYDRWKLEDGDNPGHGSNRLPLLHCSVCDWRGDFPSAVAHFRQHGHAIAHKGIVQDLSRFAPTREELMDRR